MNHPFLIEFRAVNIAPVQLNDLSVNLKSIFERIISMIYKRMGMKFRPI
jgi:hypothetical protein